MIVRALSFGERDARAGKLIQNRVQFAAASCFDGTG
jgi:hypothetical protein